MYVIGGAIRRFLARAGAEDGFTMATAMLALLVVSLAMAAMVSAVRGDIQLTNNDLDHKRAYEAAEAGLADYSYHLNKDNAYWSKCTNVPMPNAVNNVGSTTKRRPVPGGTGATYSLELIPATGKSVCSTADPVGSMIEQSSGVSNGTFRVRSTGYSGNTKVAIVASFKRASFLDYVYFTQYETLDPVAYGYTDPTSIASANSQCAKTYRAGRPNSPIANTGGTYCSEIVFSSGEQINGPLHTNDELNICGNPTFGRSVADLIEVSAPPTGWRSSGNCGSGSPTFKGTYLTSSPVLTPPNTNKSLRNVQGAQVYTGQTEIVLGSGSTMQVKTNGASGFSTVPIPSSGVIYVANSTSQACSSAYSPFTATYPTTSPCGNAIVSGPYSSRITIAAENDVIISGNLTRSGSGMLGLIANNFIRVKHNLSNNATSASSCGSGNSNSGSVADEIDAAMLSLQHSFIVDHYNCGNPLGTLTVSGAISQKFRGPVGTVSGGSTQSGYSKNYNYDDRLRYLAPPNFLDPVESAWHMQRQTLTP